MELAGIDQLWGAGITYIRLETEFVYMPRKCHLEEIAGTPTQCGAAAVVSPASSQTIRREPATRTRQKPRETVLR
jgi:hypothetical protein